MRGNLIPHLSRDFVINETLTTTVARAKRVRSFVERSITQAKKGDLAARRRLIARFKNKQDVVEKLLDDIGPRFSRRSSGFVRVRLLGKRRGDAAEMGRLEFVEPRSTEEDETQKKAKVGVGRGRPASTGNEKN